MANKKISDLTASLLTLKSTDIIEVSVWNGTTFDSRKVNGSDLGVLSVKVSLAAVQITNAGSTAVSLIAATGAGTYIDVVSASYNFKYGATAFNSDATTFELITDTAAQEQYLSSGVLNGTATVFGKFDLTSSASNQLVENKALTFALTGSNATVGDSTMDLYINYKIVTI
jgi:hypothetical protein